MKKGRLRALEITASPCPDQALQAFFRLAAKPAIPNMALIIISAHSDNVGMVDGAVIKVLVIVQLPFRATPTQPV